MFKLLYIYNVCYIKMLLNSYLPNYHVYDVTTTAGVFLPIHSSAGPKNIIYNLSFRSLYNYYIHYIYT